MKNSFLLQLAAELRTTLDVFERLAGLQTFFSANLQVGVSAKSDYIPIGEACGKILIYDLEECFKPGKDTNPTSA